MTIVVNIAVKVMEMVEIIVILVVFDLLLSLVWAVVIVVAFETRRFEYFHDSRLLTSHGEGNSGRPFSRFQGITRNVYFINDHTVRNSSAVVRN